MEQQKLLSQQALDQLKSRLSIGLASIEKSKKEAEEAKKAQLDKLDAQILERENFLQAIRQDITNAELDLLAISKQHKDLMRKIDVGSINFERDKTTAEEFLKTIHDEIELSTLELNDIKNEIEQKKSELSSINSNIAEKEVIYDETVKKVSAIEANEAKLKENQDLVSKKADDDYRIVLIKTQDAIIRLKMLEKKEKDTLSTIAEKRKALELESKSLDQKRLNFNQLDNKIRNMREFFVDL